MAAFSCYGRSGARALDHLQELPRLAPGQRAARRDLHRVPFLRLTLLVMREKLGGATDELAVRLVPEQPLDLDGHRLLHLGADDAAREGAGADGFHFRFCLVLFGAHYLLTPALFSCASRAMVFNRAM